MKILGIGNAIIDVICKVEENFITKNNFMVPFVRLFLVRKLSSTLQMTSIIAFPIPRIFILSLFSFNRFLSIRITSGTNFTSHTITLSCFTKFSPIIYDLKVKFVPTFFREKIF